MTSPRHAPQFGTWSVPNCQLIIEYDLEVLEAVRRKVTAGFETSGGLEIAGLLLGSYSGERVRITGFEPILCDHAFGPMFIPSSDDTARLAQQLLGHEEQASSGGEMVVGWYQSHVRRGLALSPEDIKIYDGHFPQPWQVALLLRPAPAGSVHARFFLRESGAAIAQQAAIPASDETAPTRIQGAGSVRDQHPPTAVTPAPAADEPRQSRAPAAPKPPSIRVPVENTEEPARAVRSGARSRGIQSMAVWSVLAAMFVLAVASAFYLRFHFAVVTRSPDTLQLAAGIRDSGLEIRWDPKALGEVRQGRLEVRNGSAVQQFSLDRETLIYGRFTCFPKSDVTNLRLHVDRTDGAVLEGSTTYVARSVPVETVAQAAPVPTLPPDPALANPPNRSQPNSPPLPPKPAPKETTVKTPAEEHKSAAPPPTTAETRSTGSSKQTVETSKKAPPAASVILTAKQTPSTSNVASQPEQDEPPKPKPESSAPDPVQTAQVQRQTQPELPAQVQTPPIQIQPAPAPPSRAAPQQTPPTPSMATPSQFRLGGRWVLQSGGYSRSPAVPESLAITLTDTDGAVHGTLEARYKSRSRPGRVHFSFSGKVSNGVARFGWTSSDGQSSQIEFIRIPNSPDVVEVVWKNPETKQVFDEMLRRAN
jgi:proteasome lid subunit RPN8/RPN11